MHDIRSLRADPAILKAAMARRHKPEEAAKVDEVVSLDQEWRKLVAEKEGLLARRNAASKEIGQAMAAKDAARAEALKAEVAAGKERLAVLEAETGRREGEIRDILAGIPNIPHEDVPEGADEHGNVEYESRPRNDVPGSSAPRPAKRRETGPDHVSLGEALGMMDFESAAKLSGARFVVLNRHLARLERALGQFMLDLHTEEHSYTEVNPPILVRDEAMFGTAQLPKFKEDQFWTSSNKFDEYTPESLQDNLSRFGISVEDVTSGMIKKTRLEILEKPSIEKYEFLHKQFSSVSQMNAFLLKNLGELEQLYIGNKDRLERERHWLIPTAEVPLTNLVREKILSEEELPLRFTALTPCFRAEAGSAGRDTRGMLRQHQFMKCELVSITTPETSRDEHERMLACAETVLKKLGLHFRTMTLCTGDMGFASRKTYDIEVWLPGQNTYREISSCSVCGDFQARRMEARCRAAGAKETRFVHTLNGSGVAVGRALIAVMENYQNEDGSITVPDVLVPYMGGLKRIERV